MLLNWKQNTKTVVLCLAFPVLAVFFLSIPTVLWWSFVQLTTCRSLYWLGHNSEFQELFREKKKLYFFSYPDTILYLRVQKQARGKIFNKRLSCFKWLINRYLYSSSLNYYCHWLVSGKKKNAFYCHLQKQRSSLYQLRILYTNLLLKNNFTIQHATLQHENPHPQRICYITMFSKAWNDFTS